jgi:hypothetical protein
MSIFIYNVQKICVDLNFIFFLRFIWTIKVIVFSLCMADMIVLVVTLKLLSSIDVTSCGTDYCHIYSAAFAGINT